MKGSENIKKVSIAHLFYLFRIDIFEFVFDSFAFGFSSGFSLPPLAINRDSGSMLRAP